MNLQDYLINPMGRGSTVLMLSDTRRMLDDQYLKIRDRIQLKWYIFNHNEYIAHLKIPSRTHDKLFYDVIFEFDIDSLIGGMSVINSANVKVFSNCPSFTYTYAYTFCKKDDLCTWTKGKYQKDILSKEPKKRNPDKLISYERSIYFAAKYVTSNGRNYKSRIDTMARTITKYQEILQQIATNEEIETRYKLLSDEKRKQRDRELKNGISSPKADKPKKTTQYAKNGLKKTKTTNQTKTVRKSKRTKKI